MTKNKGGQSVVLAFMEERGFGYVEQLGSGYFFKSPSEKK